MNPDKGSISAARKHHFGPSFKKNFFLPHKKINHHVDQKHDWHFYFIIHSGARRQERKAARGALLAENNAPSDEPIPAPGRKTRRERRSSCM